MKTLFFFLRGIIIIRGFSHFAGVLKANPPPEKREMNILLQLDTYISEGHCLRIRIPNHCFPEDGSRVFVRGVGIYPQDCTVSQPRRPQSKHPCHEYLKPYNDHNRSKFV